MANEACARQDDFQAVRRRCDELFSGLRFDRTQKPLAATSMTVPIKFPSFRKSCLPVISGLAMILAAAVFDPDQNWVRLRGLPIERRAKLVENLKKFDLLYSRSKQDSLRELDRKIHVLPNDSRTHYLAVLARYHNWLNQLPESKQDELEGLPSTERMAAVKKLAADYPLINVQTSRFLRMVDVGEYSPFELASLFKIWQDLTPEKRREIERLPAIPRRHEAMRKGAEEKDIPHEIKPSEFDELVATQRFEQFAGPNRPVLLLKELRKKKDDAHVEIGREILRRQVINYYFLNHPAKSVTPERLSEFLAAFPAWLQSTFDPHSPEEAQRRLTVVYRLVFPPPQEFKPTQRPSAPAPAERPVTKQPARPARPGGNASSRTGAGPL
jgi:hypothetical protein